jgi:hypothetical protein
MRISKLLIFSLAVFATRSYALSVLTEPMYNGYYFLAFSADEQINSDSQDYTLKNRADNICSFLNGETARYAVAKPMVMNPGDIVMLTNPYNSSFVFANNYTTANDAEGKTVYPTYFSYLECE